MTIQTVPETDIEIRVQERPPEKCRITGCLRAADFIFIFEHAPCTHVPQRIPICSPHKEPARKRGLECSNCKAQGTIKDIWRIR